MACTCAPALTMLRKEYTALFPGRDQSSDGCCPSAAHTAANPKSDHEPGKSAAAKGKARAVDLDEDYAKGLGARPLDPLVPFLLKDPRAKYTIYEGVLTYPDGTTRKNKGHEKHLHLSIHDWAVNDTRPWNIAKAFKAAPAPIPEPEPEDPDMAANRKARGSGPNGEWWAITALGKRHIQTVGHARQLHADGLLDSPTASEVDASYLDELPTIANP